jgi:hypothetical protein
MSELDPRYATTIDATPSEPLRGFQPSASPLPGGGRLFGGYRILRPLGKGGMGTVYEAEELATGRRLALKVLSHSLDSEQARTPFFREGRLAASLNHPNSVYVFGTEEIDGMPVITMELAPGGTLQELIERKGPLPVTQAVDAILQIIAGLEAAASGGVLHRDVKPSNCFLDSDGAVKVGDFGLSISTLARGEVNLTTPGALLGTPAYASPEQLRGDELDSRSDIYAVGVTLYYLLTGRTPFTADNMVRLLATVLERQPESPRKLRPEIPEELAQVILRCLAKQPAQRFRSYNELRLALLPFTSAVSAPASAGLRALAGLIDLSLMLGLFFVLLFAFSSSLTAPSTDPVHEGPRWFPLFIYLIPILVLILPEGLCGATAGKAALGLRVVGLKRNTPGIIRAFLRTAIVLASFMVGIALKEIFFHGSRPGRILSYVAVFTPYVFLPLLWVTARRRNRQAAVQDLLSGTRVILRPNWQTRCAARAAGEPAPATVGTPQVGPYHVLAELGRSDSSEIAIGYDTRLFRKVWIRQVTPGTPEVAPALRMLTRGARLRWLGGQRASGQNGGGNWDAYEALTGQPLTTLLCQPQPWKRVRFWLTDLAAELETAEKEHTLPHTLGLDQVWITDDGRAKLLDFVAPGVRACPRIESAEAVVSQGDRPVPSLQNSDLQRFLKRAAVAALEGRSATVADQGDYAPRTPMPLYARTLVARMGAFASFEVLVAELRRVRNMPAEITPARRLVLLAGCVLPALMIAAAGMLFLWMGTTIIGNDPNLRQFMELNLCLSKLPSLKQQHHGDGLDQTMEIYVAGHFRGLISNPTEWNDPAYRALLTPDQRHAAESIAASHAVVSEKQLAEATERVKPLGVDLVGADQASKDFAAFTQTSRFIPIAAMMATSTWALYTGVPAILAAALFRGGLLVHGLGLALVTRSGVPARRWRVLCRGLIVWLPPVVASPLAIPLASHSGATMCIMLLVCGYVTAAVWSLRRPACGLQDLLAGTRMVPR